MATERKEKHVWDFLLLASYLFYRSKSRFEIDYCGDGDGDDALT